jgi:predicted PurR-regulated permease PerM
MPIESPPLAGTTTSLTPADLVYDSRIEAEGTSRPFIAVVVATAVLYLAKDILLPLAMASMLAVVFAPIARRLDKLVGALVSSLTIVLAAVIGISSIGYFLAVELTSVAVEVAGYSDNIAAKLGNLEGSTPAWLRRIEGGVKDVQQQLKKITPPVRLKPPTLVQTQPNTLPTAEILKQSIPVVSAFGETLLVIVLLFFLLYERRDLRERVIRLAARSRIALAQEAIATAGAAVGHYLLLFSITNLGFGIVTGFIVWMLGLPHPEFWGALAFLLRFIPYVGVLMSATLPALVAFAVFPGWAKSFEVLASFILLDQVAAQFVEPILIGRGIGVSPVAVLVSVMYWGWLWGVPGMLLATALTACLKVAGDYIPALGFLGILLGSENILDDMSHASSITMPVAVPAAQVNPIA